MNFFNCRVIVTHLHWFILVVMTTLHMYTIWPHTYQPQLNSCLVLYMVIFFNITTLVSVLSHSTPQALYILTSASMYCSTDASQ